MLRIHLLVVWTPICFQETQFNSYSVRSQQCLAHRFVCDGHTSSSKPSQRVRAQEVATASRWLRREAPWLPCSLLGMVRQTACLVEGHSGRATQAVERHITWSSVSVQPHVTHRTSLILFLGLKSTSHCQTVDQRH